MAVGVAVVHEVQRGGAGAGGQGRGGDGDAGSPGQCRKDVVTHRWRTPQSGPPGRAALRRRARPPPDGGYGRPPPPCSPLCPGPSFELESAVAVAAAAVVDVVEPS